HNQTIDLIKNFDMGKLRKVSRVVGTPAPVECTPSAKYFNIDTVPVIKISDDSSDSDNEFDDNYDYNEYSTNVVVCDNIIHEDISEELAILDDDDAAKLETFADNTLIHIYELTKNSDKYLADRCAAEL